MKPPKRSEVSRQTQSCVCVCGGGGGTELQTSPASRHKLQQEFFRATRPAAPARRGAGAPLECARPPSSLGLCFCVVSLFSLSLRTPRWGLASPSQEGKTSLTRTPGTRRWSCRTCCQTGRPSGDCCKFTSNKKQQQQQQGGD